MPRAKELFLPRGAILALLALPPSLVAACANAPAYDPSLTPAQNELAQANARFDTTTGANCAVGASAGAALGLAKSITSGVNPAPVSNSGGGIGAKLGCGAGYLVARSARSGPDAAIVSNDEVLQAQQDVAAWRRAAAAAGQIALDARIALTAPGSRQSLASYRGSASLMTRQVLGMQRESDALRQDSALQSRDKSMAMNAAAAQIDAARAQTQQALEDLNATLATLPAGI